MLRSGEYHSHISEVEKLSSVEYPDAELSLNKKVVYEEKDIEGSHHHHHLFRRHHRPESRESVKVVEYEQVPERRVADVVVYEDNRTLWP
ncbi:hypothetical protein Fmac_008896 [Flemingia macrophylla]|uniref:Uncharacterized protein n=1 Tax=Flemingia macrophylla TaxID=520843 RepID=A0ABD1MYP9_9FABA